MMYAIIIPGKKERYVNWCDERWYETTKEKRFIFTKEECERIYGQMLNHYVLSLIFEGEDGTREIKQWKSQLRSASIDNDVTQYPKDSPTQTSYKKMVFKVR